MADKVYAIPHTFQSAAGATANGTAMDVGGLSGVGVQVEGITSATVTFEGTIDGSTWYSVQVMNVTSGAVAATTTADGLFLAPVAGLDQFRARISTFVSGTITVTGKGLVNMAGVSLADIDVAGSETVVLGAGTASIGKLGANSGVDIGDVDVTSLPGAVQGPGNPTVDSYSCAVVNLAASSADQVLVTAPAAGKQIWVYGLFMMADTAAGTVTLQDEDDTALSGTMAISDEGGWVLPLSGNFAMPWIKVATAKALECDTGACTIDGILCYAIVTV